MSANTYRPTWRTYQRGVGYRVMLTLGGSMPMQLQWYCGACRTRHLVNYDQGFAARGRPAISGRCRRCNQWNEE